MTDELNPYSAPQAEVLTVPEAVETDRREHLGAETRLRAFGALMHVWGLALVLILMQFWRVVSDLEGLPSTRLVGSPMFSLALGAMLLGFQLYRLRRWAAWVLVFLLSFALLASALNFQYPADVLTGVVLSSAALVLLLNRRARRVLAPDYRRVIHHTPHIGHRARTALWVLAYMGVLFLFAVLMSLIRP